MSKQIKSFFNTQVLIGVLQSGLGELNVFEFCYDFQESGLALGPKLADRAFLDVSPLAVLALLIFLEMLIELP